MRTVEVSLVVVVSVVEVEPVIVVVLVAWATGCWFHHLSWVVSCCIPRETLAWSPWESLSWRDGWLLAVACLWMVSPKMPIDGFGLETGGFFGFDRRGFVL